MPEVEDTVLAGAKLPYVIHVLRPSPGDELLRALLLEAIYQCTDPRRIGLQSRVIDASNVLLVGNGAIGPPMEDYQARYMNITHMVMYVNLPVVLTTFSTV